MCCLFTILALMGPRAGAVIWWLLEPVRWQATFDGFILPFLGWLFLPWTTLMYVAVAPRGVDGLEWFWLGGAFLMDLLTLFGGAYGNRGRLSGARLYR